MKVRLLSYTPKPERLVAMAARLCYSDATIEDLADSLTEEKIASLIGKLVGAGHMTPFEHAGFTFGIEGVSRVTTHQLVRHRIASYSQQSFRYVTMGEKYGYIVPEKVKEKEAFATRFVELARSAHQLYTDMVEAGVPAEDARYILPSGSQTKIIVTMNARELRHFFSLRCCQRAQWELRSVAEEMLRQVKGVAPRLFEAAGAPCERGPCPEGEMSCGRRAKKAKPRTPTN